MTHRPSAYLTPVLDPDGQGGCVQPETTLPSPTVRIGTISANLFDPWSCELRGPPPSGDAGVEQQESLFHCGKPESRELIIEWRR